MSTQIISLEKNGRFYTEVPDQIILVQAGGVYISIIPWDHGTAGQAVPFTDVSAADRLPIPAFRYRDAAGQNFCFCLSAKEPGTVLELRDQSITQPLRKNFLSHAKIDMETYRQEGGAKGGYENCLTAFYNKKIAEDRIIIDRKGRDPQQIKGSIFKRILGGLSNKQSAAGLSGPSVYRAVQFAARKCGITNVAKENVILAALGDAPMTVPEIARISHFICRDITLDLDWYKSDCGVLIGELNVEAEKRKKIKKTEKTNIKNKKPAHHFVVCFPARGGYRMYDVETGTFLKMTRQLSMRLEPKAFSIRRSLPQASVRRKDIIAFVKKGFRRADIISLLTLQILCTLIGVLLPKLNQLIYDSYIPLGDISPLVQVCIVMASFMLGNVFISIVKNLQQYRIPCRVGYELQDAVYQRVFELPERFFRDYDSADLAQRLAGIGILANQIVSIVLTNGFSLAVSIIYIIQMIHYSGRLTVAGLLMLAVYGCLIFFLSTRTIHSAREMARFDGESSGKLYQYISGIDKIRMAGAEDRAILEYTNPVVQEKRLGIRINRNQAFTEVLIDAGSTIFSMVLYAMMVKMDLKLSIGGFMAFTAAFGTFTGIVMNFVHAGNALYQMKPIVERFRPILTQEPENDIDKDMVNELKGEISVENVTFSYNPEVGSVLQNLSLHVNPGEYIAIVGPSGCGKSTLLKLLLGFEKPDSGKITYDKKDIASLDKHMLRKQIGVVLQNGKLISGSIYENITITSRTPSVEKAWKVIEDVGLKEDINDMPMGIHTVMSESGNTISGGQQQRILIARAIYSDPSILYFDEATSALDNITQAKVCASLDKRHMTRVVIAHRLSTVRNCDRIIVMNQGRIVEEGNYDTLMALHGQFYAMAERQLV